MRHVDRSPPRTRWQEPKQISSLFTSDESDAFCPFTTPFTLWFSWRIVKPGRRTLRRVSMYTFKQFQEPEWTGHVWTWCVILADKATLGSCNFKKCSILRSVYSGLYDRDRGHCETPIRKALDSWKIRFCMILCFCLKDSVLLLCTWHGSSPSTNFPAWTVCALFWPLCQRSSESSDSWNILEYKYMVTPPSEPTFSIF
jgi:hypothetical protein